MKRLALFILLSGAPLSAAMYAAEPIIGGRCEGCEYVFVGMPDAISSQARIAPTNEPGDSLVIEGTVRTQDGSVAPDIIVYAYHTNREGNYPRGDTRHGRLRGWAKTDANGHYRFDTIRPASYPNSRVVQHVHMHVIEPGEATYWIDDIIFEDDPFLTPERRENMQRGRGGNGLAVPAKDTRGVWHVRRDITLRLNVPE